MCSTLRPRSRTSVFSPFSQSSFAAQPPEIPEPTTIASYEEPIGVVTRSSCAAVGPPSRAVAGQGILGSARTTEGARIRAIAHRIAPSAPSQLDALARAERLQ